MRTQVPSEQQAERGETGESLPMAVSDSRQRRQKSDKPVITLILPRGKRKRLYTYGVQIACLDDEGHEHVSVRLYDEDGNKDTDAEVWVTYDPKNWMAAPAGKLGEITLLKGEPPQVWYPYIDFRSDIDNVYDYPGGGDYTSNNGQHDWPDRDWKAEWDKEEKLREAFEVKKAQWRREMEEEDMRRRDAWGEGFKISGWNV